MNISKKRCERDAISRKFFISLVDYRNNLFISDNPNDIMKFYESFQSRDDLIEWMKERPKGAAYIHEVEGTKDIIVVIPTADFDGKYAKECRENIFKGLHTIFVESGEIPDPYFNYAHNCNVGIRKAMEYNPKWIVFSNDDIYRIDPAEILARNLRKLDNSKIDLILVQDGKGRLNVNYRGKLNLIGILLLSVLDHLNDEHLKKMPKNLYEKFIILKNIGEARKIQQYRFGEYFHMGHSRLFCLLKKNITKYYLSEYFGIFSANLLKKRGKILFDETFINGNEDQDLSISLAINNERISAVPFQIGSVYGASLGNDRRRILRGIASDVYMNHKMSKNSIANDLCGLPLPH